MVSKVLNWFSTPPPDSNSGHGAAAALLALVLSATFFLNAWKATLKLFWFDEVTSIATILSPSGIWAALQAGIDSSAPLFAVLESWSRYVPLPEQVGLRLPSMLGAMGLSICMFAAFRIRLGPVPALIAAIFPLLTTLQSTYAIEARAYELLACFAASAWLCWLRASRPRWASLMALSLAAAVSVHYLAVLIFLPFAAGEAVRWLRTRELRIFVCAALLAGATPLIFFWPLLAGLKGGYATNFWAKPSLIRLPAQYDSLVELGDGVGAGLAVVIGIGLLLLLASSWRDRAQENTIPVEDVAVSLAFLLLPVASYLLAKISGGGNTARYAIPMLLGMAGGAAQLAYWLGRRTGVLLLALILAISCMRETRILAQNIGQPSPVSALPPDVLEASVSRGLPLVIGGALEYLTFAYYNQGRAPFVMLVDPQAAIQYIGTDSLDRNLALLRDFMPLNVQMYPEFREKHASFLLYSQTSDAWSWWPERLAKDGRHLQPLAVHQNHTLFLVN